MSRKQSERPLALVTGGARRIGAHITLALAERGADVVIHYRSSADEAGGLADQVRGLGVEAWTVAGDLAVPGVAESLVREAASAAGRPVTWLVNNASSYARSDWDSLDWERFQRDLFVDAWAPFALMRGLADQTRDGAVVNLLDTRLADVDATHLGYHFAKAALHEMTKVAARILAPHIRVNGVSPGPVLEPVGTKPGRFLERMASIMPLRRTPGPDEVASMVCTLLAARSTTGQVVAVDAGRHLGWPIGDEDAPAVRALRKR